MDAQQAIELAKKNISENPSMEDSAKLCLEDAEWLLANGRPESAMHRAVDSLRFSVGVFHSDYQEAYSAT